jgi:hypothetical protein
VTSLPPLAIASIGALPRVPLDALSLAIYLALFVVAIALTRVRPALGLALLVACDPYDYAHYVRFTTITLAKVALVGVAIGLVIHHASLRPLRARSSLPLLSGAIAIAVATALTAIPGVYIDAVARETLKAFEYLGLFCVAVVARGADDDDRPVWYALFATTTLVCLGAIIQEFTIAPSGVMIGGRVIARIAGPLEGPNQLAGFLDIALPLLGARALRDRDRIASGVFFLALVTDVLTLSRAGAIGAIVGIATVVFFFATPRTRRPLAIGAAAVGTIASVALARAGILLRLFSASDVDTASGLGSRGELWHAAIGFWRANPILGIGAGNFELDLPQVGILGVRTHANSLYLQSLAEGGVVLFAATVWTIVAAVRTLLVRAPREALFVGVGAATLALATHQIFDFLTFFTKVGGFWWLWLGIATGALARIPHDEVARA